MTSATTPLRAVTERLILTGVLETLGPLVIGGHLPGRDIDVLQVCDGLGHPIIPGTALAGALQSSLTDFGSEFVAASQHLRQQAASGDTRSPLPPTLGNASLWGASGEGDQGWASRVLVDDAILLAPTSTMGGEAPPVGLDPRRRQTRHREGIAIDQTTGTAEQHKLFSMEYLPIGSRFELSIEFHANSTHSGGIYSSENGESLLHEISSVLANGIQIGRAGSRGFGAVRLMPGWSVLGARRQTPALLLDSLSVGPADVVALAERARADDSSSVRLVLPVSGSSTGGSTDAEAGPRADGAVRWTVPWLAHGPVMSRSSAALGAASGGPRVEITADGKMRLVLAGSSLKGAIRAQSWKIITTLTRSSSHRQGGLSLMAEVFGRPDASHSTAPSKRGDALLALRGALTVRDTYAVLPYTIDEWQRLWQPPPIRTVAGAAVDSLQAAVNELNDKHYGTSGVWLDVAGRTAIDRWTGGAAESRLFVTVEPHITKKFAETQSHETSPHGWRPLDLELNLAVMNRRLPSDDDGRTGRSAVTLINLVLRDLAEGWFTFGFGGTRGYGSVQIDLNDTLMASPGRKEPISLQAWFDPERDTETSAEVNAWQQAINTIAENASKAPEAAVEAQTHEAAQSNEDVPR